MNNPLRLRAVVDVFAGVLQAQYTPWANRRTHATANTAGPHDVLSLLRVSAHVDPHFAMRRAVAAANALATVGRDPEATLEFLY